MLRSLVKTGAACALNWTRADQMIGSLATSRYLPLVIGYHQVVERSQAPDGSFIPAMRITTAMFERHLDWLGRRFRFLSLDELGKHLESRQPFEEPVAVITFDDGYRDNYYHAFPILKRKGIPAGIFVVTDLVGTSGAQIYDRLYLQLARVYSAWPSASVRLAKTIHDLGITFPQPVRLSRTAETAIKAMDILINGLPQADVYRIITALEAGTGGQTSVPDELLPVTWDMLTEMHRGGMTIGSHTKTHVVLINEPLSRIHEEVMGSRQVLEKTLGITVEHFAYPSGQFDNTAVAAVAVSGYRFGYTTCRHRDPDYAALTIPRILLWENSCLDVLGRFSSAIMSCHAYRVFDLVTPCTLNHGGPRPPSWSWPNPAAPRDGNWR